MARHILGAARGRGAGALQRGDPYRPPPAGGGIQSTTLARPRRRRFMAERHFVKYTFIKVTPEWRRLDAGARAQHKAELLAACEDFADGHLLQSFSLVGT